LRVTHGGDLQNKNEESQGHAPKVALNFATL
jgi:hypothetical protein